MCPDCDHSMLLQHAPGHCYACPCTHTCDECPHYTLMPDGKFYHENSGTWYTRMRDDHQ